MEQQTSNSVDLSKPLTDVEVDITKIQGAVKASSRGLSIDNQELIELLDKYSIEDVVELKISRFLDKMGSFHPENMYELIISKVEKPLLIQILRRVGGNPVQASKILGINRNTLRKKMRIYNI